jgi:hypothetical protein
VKSVGDEKSLSAIRTVGFSSIDERWRRETRIGVSGEWHCDALLLGLVTHTDELIQVLRLLFRCCFLR